MVVKLKMFFILSAVFVLFSGVCVFADEEKPSFALRTISCDYTGDNELYFDNKQTYTIYSKYNVDVICLQCVEHPKNCGYEGLWFYSKQPFSVKEHYYAGVDRAIKQADFIVDYDCYIVSVGYDPNVLTNPFPIYSYNHEQVPKGNHDLLAEIFKKAFNGTLEKDPNYKPAPVNPKDFNESEAVKDITLGYIKDVEYKTTTYDSSSETSGRRFVWNKSQSSTGYSFSDDVFVQIYADLYYVKTSFWKNEDKSSVGKGDFDEYEYCIASSGLFEAKFFDFRYDSNNPLHEQFQFIQDNKGFVTSGEFRLDLKVRLVKKDSSGWKYGGWLKIFDVGGDYYTEDEEGNNTDIPDDGHVEIDNDGNETETVSENVDLVWFLKQLTSLKDALGQFPELVSSVFGFLPSQLLTLIGVGIAAVVIIALVKAVL